MRTFSRCSSKPASRRIDSSSRASPTILSSFSGCPTSRVPHPQVRALRPTAESTALFQNSPVRPAKDGLSISNRPNTPGAASCVYKVIRPPRRRPARSRVLRSLQHAIVLFDQRHHFTLQKIRIAFSLGLTNSGISGPIGNVFANRFFVLSMPTIISGGTFCSAIKRVAVSPTCQCTPAKAVAGSNRFCPSFK